MRRRRKKRIRTIVIWYRLLSFLCETMSEIHSRQAREAELGKALTAAEPWATERSASSATAPWERKRQRQRSVTAGREMEKWGWLKKNGSLKEFWEGGRNERRERGLCSAAIWPVHWSRTLTLAAEEEEEERKGSKGAEESSVLCLKREVCLYYFNLIHSGTQAHKNTQTHACTQFILQHRDVYIAAYTVY